MAQAKRGPKAKPKAVEPVIDDRPYLPAGYSKEGAAERWPTYREQRIWELSRDLLLSKARNAGPIYPAGIVELVEQAKLLDREVGG
jgi:hypothetical protein